MNDVDGKKQTNPNRAGGDAGRAPVAEESRHSPHAAAAERADRADGTGWIGSDTDQSSLSSHLIMAWVFGMLILLPLDFMRLPLNMIPVDYWVLGGLPLLWFIFLLRRQVIRLPYAIPMWLIFFASLMSIFDSPSPRNSFMVILKEGYAYAWFVLLVAVLSTISAKDFRRVLIFWSGIVFVHGLIIVGQFLSPRFWHFTLSLADRTNEFDVYRPAGLFLNANSAAFFQVLGFAPVILACTSKKTAVILGLLMLPPMMLTGSMGATVAFVAGLTVAILVTALRGQLVSMLKVFTRLAVALLLLGGVLYLAASGNDRYRMHFERIFLGRAERSSEGRFELWKQGRDAFVEYDVFLWGIGPENFRVVSAKGKQLHNDLLAFSVERGLVGTLGLVLFAILAAARALYVILLQVRFPRLPRLTTVVLLGAVVATIVESLTHQVFHFRELWVVLALQEALLSRMTTAIDRTRSAAHSPSEVPVPRRGLVVQPEGKEG